MLTDTEIRKKRPGEKPIKMQDSGGLMLVVWPGGAKTWRVRSQVAGKDRITTLGTYPAMTLVAARAARDALRNPPPPEPPPPPERPLHTFEAVAREWHTAQARRWKPHHSADVLASLAADVFPTLGARPVGDIRAGDILAVLRPIEVRSADLAHRARQRISAVLDYAVALDWAAANPAASLTRVLAPVVRSGRRAAVTTIEEAREVLAAAEAVPAHPLTRLALRFLALTAVRPGELRAMEWPEVDGAVWTIPAARMKSTRERAADVPPHVVPLSRQAVEVLEQAKRMRGRDYVFTAWGSQKPLSENAIGYLMHRAGYHGRQTAHGWRATFSSVMNERHPQDRAVIDLMLAHVPDGVEARYNRATHMQRRAELAQEWADLLQLGPAAELMELPRK